MNKQKTLPLYFFFYIYSIVFCLFKPLFIHFFHCMSYQILLRAKTITDQLSALQGLSCQSNCAQHMGPTVWLAHPIREVRWYNLETISRLIKHLASIMINARGSHVLLKKSSFSLTSESYCPSKCLHLFVHIGIVLCHFQQNMTFAHFWNLVWNVINTFAVVSWESCVRLIDWKAKSVVGMLYPFCTTSYKAGDRS